MLTLTTEQLEELKDKILAKKCRPIHAIRELYPNEDINHIRTQLFDVYPRQTLIVKSEHPHPSLSLQTREEHIASIDIQLANLEERKKRLLEEKDL